MMKGIDSDLEEDTGEMATEGNDVYKCKELIHENLISTGQMDLLKRLIQNRLAESGWTSNLKLECVDYIKLKGMENVNVSHMVEDIHTIGRARFPPELRTELYSFLTEFAQNYVEIDESAPPPPPASAHSSTGFPFHYQSRNAIPDPGLGIGIPISPESTTGSSSSSQSTSDEEENRFSLRSRSLGKKSSELPLLHPENLEITEGGGSEVEIEENSQSDDEEGFDNEGYEVEEYVVDNVVGSDGFLGVKKVEKREMEYRRQRNRGRNEPEEEEDESSSKSNNEEEEEEELMDV